VFFSVQELEVKKIHFEVDFPPGEIDFEESQFRQVSQLHTEGTAELLSNSLGEIRVTGTLRVEMEVDCDRCLEPTRYPMDGAYNLYYRPAPKVVPGHDIAIDEGEAQIGFYEGHGLELTDVVREHVLLSIPMQVICREDCAGICPQCGLNRNVSPCDCHHQPANEVWAALRDFKLRAKPDLREGK
jgi:uncharacterized protein